MDPEKKRFLARVLADIQKLPPEERTEALETMVSIFLSALSTSSVRKVRSELVRQRQRAEHADEQTAVLNLIDGHLALRELGIQQG